MSTTAAYEWIASNESEAVLHASSQAVTMSNMHATCHVHNVHPNKRGWRPAGWAEGNKQLAWYSHMS